LAIDWPSCMIVFSCVRRVGVTYCGFSISSCAKARAEVAQKSGSGRQMNWLGFAFAAHDEVSRPGHVTDGESLTCEGK
jgi:hypothetical protein